MNAKGFTDEGVFTPDSLIVGEFPRIARKVIITGGSFFSRGTVLGRISSSKSYTISASEASDGSQTPNAILAEDIDTSDQDREAIVYFTGEFNASAIKLGAGHSVESIFDDLRSKSIFIRG